MKNTTTLEFRSIADGLGILSSAACALHCLSLPILLLAGTTLPASFLTDESFHRAALWVVIPSALFGFGLGCWRHKDGWVLLMGAIGLAGISLAGLVLHDLIGETGERVVTFAGASLLIAAHVRNYKLCRSDRCDHSEP